ncbi:MAG: toprim domain-containing protein [Bacilli bacterium]|nr:toprim domain-containing protein [Bacilli bacterium]
MYQKLFDISRKITTQRNKYEYISSHFGLLNYRTITDSEVRMRSSELDIPQWVKSFIYTHHEVILIANIIRGKVKGMLLRSITDKAFMDYGFKKGSFYGLGSLDPGFKFGDPIMIVEGAIDCDVSKQFITRNCLAVLTSSISEARAKVLSCLTDRVLLFLDNDEAGRQGEITSKRRLESYGINVQIVPKVEKIKDLGDLLDKYRRGDLFVDTIINDIRSSVLLRGGKLV